MQTLPKDPIMLLSTVNMKLRDFYDSLDELCRETGADKIGRASCRERVCLYV